MLLFIPQGNDRHAGHSVRLCHRPILKHTRWPLRAMLQAIGLFGMLSCLIEAAAGAENRRVYDLPADTADRSLQRLSLQSGLQVMFAADVTDGVRANAVKGEFTPFEAARRLFAGTRLRVSYNEKTGVLSVTRMTDAERGGAKKKAEPIPAT